MNTQHTVTLFEQIGEMPAVDAAMEIFLRQSFSR